MTTTVAASAAASSNDPKHSPSAPLATTSKVLPTIDKVALIKQFGDLFAKFDSKTLSYVLPNTLAYLYVDGGSKLFAANVGLAPAEKASAIPGGFDLDGTKLTNFVFGAAGKIKTFKRNGISIDKTVAAGDGQVISVTRLDSDTYSGTATITIHSFRYFDGDVQIMAVLHNETNVNTDIRWSGYIVGGAQATNAATEGDTLPSVTRLLQGRFTNTQPGGIAYGSLVIDSVPHKFQVAVPTFG